jgi:hypothetical protein
MAIKKQLLVLKGKKMWHGGNLAIINAIDASIFYRKHKHKNEMK